MMNAPTTSHDRLETRQKDTKPSPATPKATRDPVHSGMGAIVTPQGVAFRVWAPNAKSVSVVGDFDQWSERGLEMAREDNGTWYRLVPEATPGHEYRYLIETENGTLSRIDPRALKVTNSIGNGVVWKPERQPRKLEHKIPQNAMVVYEMHIGSFNPQKDGAPGTFHSAIEKLDYLRDLGINTIEVMPVSEFAGDFSWGYNPAHPYAVESAYGGPDGLLDFIDAAHERGIAVIMDVVYNHFGPSDLGVWQFDGWSENEMGGIYFYNDWRANTPWGDTRPDYGRDQVRSYIRDNAMMWLETFGCDGLRWDMSIYIRTYRGNGDTDDDLKEGWGLMQWVNHEVQAAFPGTICIAEDLRDSDWLVKDIGSGGAGFTAQWTAGFVHPLRSCLIVADDAQRALDPLIDAIRGRFDGDAFKRVIYTESHDEVANGKARVPSEISPAESDGYHARKRSTLGAVLVATSPGIPMFFQGQEFLEDEWFRDEVPLDFGKLERHAGVHQMYKDLIRLRLDTAGPTRGLSGQDVAVHHVNHLDKVLAYHRTLNGVGDVIVIVNLSNNVVENYEVGVPTPGRWQVLFNSDSRAYAADFGDTPCDDPEACGDARDGMGQSISVKVGPYSALVLVPMHKSP
jgi:1,4-alpha-glucan branching enzyme